MSEVKGTFGDREILDDLLAAQADVAGRYSQCAGECFSSALQNEFVLLLGEEHKLQMELFEELRKRGWRDPGQASEEEIQRVRERFAGEDS